VVDVSRGLSNGMITLLKRIFQDGFKADVARLKALLEAHPAVGAVGRGNADA
jgi:hypothetical protein